MKIQKITSKNLLMSCFFKNGIPKEVPDRTAAQSAFKKMAITQDDGKLKINEEEVEFTPSEVVVLKQLFDQKTEWPWNVPDEAINELKNIFYPEKQ